MPRRRVLKTIIMFFGVFAVVGMATPQFFNIITERIEVTFIPRLDQSAFTRGAMDRVAVADLVQHPLLGVGAGNYKAHVLRYQRNINFWLSPENLPNSPHDTFLQAGAELGVPGLLSLILIIAVVLSGVKCTYRLAKQYPPMGRYGIGMALFIIPLGVTLFASNIGEVTRVVWGIYFGLSLSAFKLRRLHVRLLAEAYGEQSSIGKVALTHVSLY